MDARTDERTSANSKGLEFSLLRGWTKLNIKFRDLCLDFGSRGHFEDIFLNYAFLTNIYLRFQKKFASRLNM